MPIRRGASEDCPGPGLRRLHEGGGGQAPGRAIRVRRRRCPTSAGARRGAWGFNYVDSSRWCAMPTAIPIATPVDLDPLAPNCQPNPGRFRVDQQWLDEVCGESEKPGRLPAATTSTGSPCAQPVAAAVYSCPRDVLQPWALGRATRLRRATFRRRAGPSSAPNAGHGSMCLRSAIHRHHPAGADGVG